MENQTLITAEADSRLIRNELTAAARRLIAAGIASARLDAEVLLCHVLGVERTELYLHRDTGLSIEEEERFRELLLRRARHEPAAYITGRKEFWSLDLFVTPEALIPRPETELVVEVALERAKDLSANAPLAILDVGTGSGAIAVCLAKELTEARLWAVDISAPALDVASKNSQRHGVASKIHFLHGDLFEPVEGLGIFFDLIVSNPPYIRSGELPRLAPDIYQWEPHRALDGGADGLDFYRRITYEAGRYLAPGGHIVLEIGADMGNAVAELFSRAGCYGDTPVYQDYAGKDRVIAATKILPPKLATRGLSGG